MGKDIKTYKSKVIQILFPVLSLDFLFIFFLQKRKNRKVVRKGIHKKGYRKNKGSTPISINYDLTYTVICATI